MSEIIIDGVDVSGCIYCIKLVNYRCEIQNDLSKLKCIENKNCYYKQLQRLKKENEELKKNKQKIQENDRRNKGSDCCDMERNDEIIIDGVDVSECDCLNYLNECFAHAITDYTGECFGYKKCSKFPSCSFKQLQRLKTEFSAVLDAKCGTIAALRTENDELKAKLERIKILANGRLSLCEDCEGNIKSGKCDEPCTAYEIWKELK